MPRPPPSCGHGTCVGCESSIGCCRDPPRPDLPRRRTRGAICMAQYACRGGRTGYPLVEPLSLARSFKSMSYRPVGCLYWRSNEWQLRGLEDSTLDVSGGSSAGGLSIRGLCEPLVVGADVRYAAVAVIRFRVANGCSLAVCCPRGRRSVAAIRTVALVCRLGLRVALARSPGTTSILNSRGAYRPRSARNV